MSEPKKSYHKWEQLEDKGPGPAYTKDVKPSKLMSISLRVTMSEPERF